MKSNIITEWLWEDERTFIIKLGKPNKSVKHEIPDWKGGKPNKYSRLELLNMYYDVCNELREIWSGEVTKDKTLDFILLNIASEETLIEKASYKKTSKRLKEE